VNTRNLLQASVARARIADMARETAAAANWKSAEEHISYARACLDADDWRAAAMHFKTAASALEAYADNTEPVQ